MMKKNGTNNLSNQQYSVVGELSQDEYENLPKLEKLARQHLQMIQEHFVIGEISMNEAKATTTTDTKALCNGWKLK